MRVNVSFDSDYLAGLDDTTPITVTLTAYEVAMLMQALPLLLNRELWESMSDNDWWALYYDVSEALSEVMT